MTRQHVKCPQCGARGFKVVHAQTSRSGHAVYRKRECGECHHWISTEEPLRDAELTHTDMRTLQALRKMSTKDRIAVLAMMNALIHERNRYAKK